MLPLSLKSTCVFCSQLLADSLMNFCQNFIMIDLCDLPLRYYGLPSLETDTPCLCYCASCDVMAPSSLLRETSASREGAEQINDMFIACNRELKQRGRERQRERCKTMD